MLMQKLQFVLIYFVTCRTLRMMLTDLCCIYLHDTGRCNTDGCNTGRCCGDHLVVVDVCSSSTENKSFLNSRLNHSILLRLVLRDTIDIITINS